MHYVNGCACHQCRIYFCFAGCGTSAFLKISRLIFNSSSQKKGMLSSHLVADHGTGWAALNVEMDRVWEWSMVHFVRAALLAIRVVARRDAEQRGKADI